MRRKYFPLFLLFVTIGYVATGELGLSQALLHANVSAIWPPTGLAIAAVWLLGYRIWPAIFVGAFLVNLSTHVPVVTAAGIALGNMLEAVSAVYLLQRFVGSHNPFDRAPDTLKFVVIVGAASTPLSATIGNLALCLTGAASWSDFGPLWLTWWLGDAVGGIVIAPLVLTWMERSADTWNARRWIEAALLLLSLSFVAAIVFRGVLLPGRGAYPLEHLIVPVLLWAAFRFTPHIAATSVALVSAIATWGTRVGFGPFGEYSPNDSLLLLQVFMAAVGITTLILAAIVAERKKTEEALRDKETQINLITDVVPVMLTQCSRDLRYMFVNRAYAEMLGMTKQELVGKKIEEVMGKNAYETIRPKLDIVLRGQSVQFEAEIPYERTGPRFMRVAYMPQSDEHGVLQGWVASLADITDRKRAEQQIEKLNSELQRRIEDFQALIDTAPVGIGVALDADCNYIWSNREFANMLGANRDKNISKSGAVGEDLPFRIIRNGKEIPPRDLPMQRACREGIEVLDEELEIVRSDGTVVPEICRATPLRDEQGRIRGCIGVFLNITDRKQSEREREELLAREQEARADAEAASRVKDEFLAVVSHELRTPLNSILGWSQLVRTGRLDAKTVAMALETIERNAKTQARLVDDLLDVSRIISGKLRLDVKSVELVSVVNSAVDSLRHALDAKNIQLRLSLDPAASPFQGDATRLQQVIWNLLANAVKFTPKDGSIEIRLERDGAMAKLIVTDSGQGIDPEFLPYVFDRFRQEDSSRTRKHGGLGLGLAIVRHLAELHGGRVEAFSAGENQGASFIVSLPLVHEVMVFNHDDLVAHSSRMGTHSETSGKRLLIVEDNPDSLEMLRVLVQRLGADVRTATTGSQAIEIIRNWIPDVVICDIGLPDEDGYTFIRKARALLREKEQEMPAIALTGYAGIHEAHRARAAGFEMYLSKPTEPAKLLSAIASLVSRGHAAGGPSV